MGVHVCRETCYDYTGSAVGDVGDCHSDDDQIDVREKMRDDSSLHHYDGATHPFHGSL